jgi:ethanolamine utilization protein EutP
MRKKRIMIIGAGRSGKSSLGRWLDQEAAAWDSAGWRAAAGNLWSRRTPALV